MRGFAERDGTGPRPHPAAHPGYAAGGRVGMRAGTAHPRERINWHAACSDIVMTDSTFEGQQA